MKLVKAQDVPICENYTESDTRLFCYVDNVPAYVWIQSLGFSDRLCFEFKDDHPLDNREQGFDVPVMVKDFHFHSLGHLIIRYGASGLLLKLSYEPYFP